MRKPTQLPPVDFVYSDEGSVSLLTPITDMARNWLADHLAGGEVQRLGTSIVIEWRYVNDIVVGIIEDGLRIGNTRAGHH